MRLYCSILTALMLSATIQVKGQQETELASPPPQTTPGTYRDPTASAISTLKSEIDVMASTEIEKLSRMSRAGTTARVRAMQYRQQVRLVRTMNQAAAQWYVKGLGVATFLADSGATILGNLYEGNLRSAAVATVDEGSKTLAAGTSAWAFGKAGAGIGTFFGGPPGAMVGGGIGAIVGAVVGTVGYNAYLSSTVTTWMGDAIEPDYFEMALKNREEHLYEEELARILRETMGEQSTATVTETPPPNLPPPETQSTVTPEAAPPVQPPAIAAACFLHIPQDLQKGWWQVNMAYDAKNHQDGVPWMPYDGPTQWRQIFTISRDQGFVLQSPTGPWVDPSNRKRRFSSTWITVFIDGPDSDAVAKQLEQQRLDYWIKEKGARYLTDKRQAVILNYTQGNESQHLIKLVFTHRNCGVFIQLSSQPGTNSDATEEMATQFGKCITQHIEEHFSGKK